MLLVVFICILNWTRFGKKTEFESTSIILLRNVKLEVLGMVGKQYGCAAWICPPISGCVREFLLGSPGYPFSTPVNSNAIAMLNSKRHTF